MYGQPIKKFKSEKYLGDQIASTLAESVSLTVDKRKGLAEHAVYEILTAVNDCRSDVVGGITTDLLLFEMVIIPMLLSNAECFFQMNNNTLQVLNSLQNKFFRCFGESQTEQ